MLDGFLPPVNGWASSSYYCELDRDIKSHHAEEVSIIKGLSVAEQYYEGGSVAVINDSQSIVDRMMGAREFSTDQRIQRSFSRIVSRFDNVTIKWTPSENNEDAHEACREIIELD